MQSASTPFPDQLRSPRLLLRLPEPADAPEIARLLGDWETVRYTARIPHPYAPGMAEEWIEVARRSREAGAAIDYVLVRPGDGALLGAIHLGIDGRVGEIGYWLGRPWWGRGLMTEAAHALLDLAFATCGLEAVGAGALAANVGSIRVLQQAGMRFVGTRLDPAPARGAEFELLWHEIERETWRKRKGRDLPLLLVSAVALIDADGRVLLAERPPGKAMAGLWEFPGGKVHDDETPEQALIRELHEELGIDTHESCLAPFTFASHRYEAFHLLMPLYVCRVWKGTPTPKEGQKLAWVRPVRMADYPMPPADRPLVAMLRDLL